MVKLSARSARIVAMLGVFVLGVGTACLFAPSSARAEAGSASVIVPPGGLTFRTPEGRLLARLSSGPAGGVFELYDAHERPAAALQAGSRPPARSLTGWSPNEISDGVVDPWRLGF